MKNNKLFFGFVLFLGCFISCSDNEIIGTNVSDLLWVHNDGVEMPVLVEGNTASKVVLLIIHGGPGGNSWVYNESIREFSEPLEADYAVAYWDQRSSGTSRGVYDKENITIANMVDDMDQVVDLLKFRYGSDISLFVLGHSWGGYLGTAYMIDEDRQAKVNGWIDVDGAHNFELLVSEGLSLMEDVSATQLGGANDMEWQDVSDFVNTNRNATVNSDLLLTVNQKAIVTEGLAQRSNLTNASEVSFAEYWSALIKENHTLIYTINAITLTSANLVDEALANPLSDQLDQIFLPTLLLWGAFDFVVPPALGVEYFENISTVDKNKELIIFNNSGHSPMATEPDLFITAVKDFIDTYR